MSGSAWCSGSRQADAASLGVECKLRVYDGERYGLFHDRFRRFLVGEQKDPIAEALGEG